ncbi:MAG: aminotransferase class I/II-fold pyridoxal phosphate-dependent enzyme [Candidatus Latescibacteria bacterium]|nr:aminotransferase class I/II-fold pyridoxal phosphate-dependent enzyme [Candidatus Latescibacterota bacterium]
MSEWEQVVEYNLSESGAHPLQLKELLAYDPSMLDQMLESELGYGYAEGSPELREAIAQYYPGATADNVLVTVGCIEANYLVYSTLLRPGDQVAIQVPNYLQGWGVANNLNADRRTFSLDPDRDWALNVDSLNEAVTDKTKLIAICNPNNPTGQILTDSEIDTIIAAADRSGAYLLADEIYAGAERGSEAVTPTIYGRYDKVLSAGSLSKAYGAPGLRIGWIVGPQDILKELWARHEYVTISTAKLSNHYLAPLVLRPDVRSALFERTRQYIRDGWTRFEPWIEEHKDILSLTPPKASAISFLRYNLKIDSVSLVERIIRDGSVLIGPGDYFGIPNHIRISYGLPHDYLMQGLGRISKVLRQVADEEGGVAAGA